MGGVPGEAGVRGSQCPLGRLAPISPGLTPPRRVMRAHLAIGTGEHLLLALDPFSTRSHPTLKL